MDTNQTFEISLTCALPLGDLVAVLTLESGDRKVIVLRDGQYRETLPQRVVHLQLTAEQIPTGEPPLRTPEEASVASHPLAGSVGSIEELFENGISVSGQRVEVQLIWGLHCHRPVDIQPTGSQNEQDCGASPERAIRFGSFEHISCAELVGMDATGKRLNIAGRRAAFHGKTLFSVGKMQLTFGEIIALAGDYYAHLDQPAAESMKEAWPDPPHAVELLAGDYRQPCLRDEEPKIVSDILHTTYRDQNASQDKLAQAKQLVRDGLFGHYPVRRYLALATQNFCHFACQPPTGFLDDEANEALQLYRAYHQRALALAGQAKEQRSDDMFMDAVVVDAFGCHFLTDLFASGHMRVPRRVLSERYGIIRGAQGLAHEMHCEDNKLGLWCTTRIPQTPRLVWRAFGDTKLFADEARPHFELVKEAVRRSAAEVFANFCGMSVALTDSAEALIPLPLAAGMGPQSGDVYPGLTAEPPTGEGNHFPKYCVVPVQKLVARRDGAPQENRYVDQDSKVAGHFCISFEGRYPAIAEARCGI